jgi:hypothetical protein
MVITYTYVLAAGQKSNTPGFMESAQWEPIENMIICDRVSDRQLQHAELVIDIFENKVVKSRDASINDADLIQTFVSRHYNEIKSALATWIQKDPSNMDRVRTFVERFKTPQEAVDVESNIN